MFQFYLATMLKKLNSLFSIILMNQNLAGLGMKFCQHISLKQMWVTRCTGGGAQRGSCFPAALLAHAGDTRPSPAAGLVPTSCPPPPWLPLRPRGSRGWGQPSPWCPVLPAHPGDSVGHARVIGGTFASARCPGPPPARPGSSGSPGVWAAQRTAYLTCKAHYKLQSCLTRASGVCGTAPAATGPPREPWAAARPGRAHGFKSQARARLRLKSSDSV